MLCYVMLCYVLAMILDKSYKYKAGMSVLRECYFFALICNGKIQTFFVCDRR